MARSSFRFRLKRLLDVREMREKQAQQELQVRRAQLATEEQRLAVMQAQEQELRGEQARPLERGADLHEFAMRRAWLETAIKDNVQEQTQQHGRIREAEQRIVEQQEVVKQRGIEVNALEKLQDKQREEHRLEQLREEGVFLDDLAGQGFLRRRGHARRVAEEERVAAEAAHDAPPPRPSASPPPPGQPTSREAAS